MDSLNIVGEFNFLSYYDISKMSCNVGMINVLKYCDAKNQANAQNKTKIRVTSTNDSSISKASNYGQYVKTSRSYNTPVKAFFGYDPSGNQLTKNQTLAQAYGLGVRFI